jgi:AcrR family transcriptional regulator
MNAEDRREQLLDAALQVIARDGYGAISIESIAREADVTRPVVYNVFDGLDALLFALLDRQERRALEQLLSTISVTPDFRNFDSFLSAAIRDLVAMVAEDPLTWRPILLAYAGTPAAVRRRIDSDRELVRARIQVVVDGVVGAAAPGIDTGVVAHALVAICEYYGRMILENPEAVDVESLASTASALLAAARQ